MRLVLIIGLVTLLNSAQAKVTEAKPTVEAPSVQAELMTELDEAPEDLDFDADDQLMLNTIDEESLIIDSEIENIATEKTETPKVEAKAPTKSNTVKKK